MFIGDRELFVPFEQFPWFRDATVREITNVELPSLHHLHWPDLDIDLAVESLEHPEKFPLVSQAQPETRRHTTTRAPRGAAPGYVVKVNLVSRDPKIHRRECSEVRRRGGVGARGQVEWQEFDSYEAGVEWGNSKGAGTVQPCRKCRPKGVTPARRSPART
jgi:hypothetical protein